MADTIEIRRTATLSDCGQYRYWLERQWDGPANGSTPAATFIMLNPSTADAEVDDPTIRRCIGFARRWGYGRLRVLNLYALRATDPKELRKSVDPVGPDNDKYLATAAFSAMWSRWPLVAAWGVEARPDRVRDVLAIVRAAHADLQSLGVTRLGHPRHPLYLPGDSQLSPWPTEPEQVNDAG